MVLLTRAIVVHSPCGLEDAARCRLRSTKCLPIPLAGPLSSHLASFQRRQSWLRSTHSILAGLEHNGRSSKPLRQICLVHVVGIIVENVREITDRAGEISCDLLLLLPPALTYGSLDGVACSLLSVSGRHVCIVDN
jgi:hypothetical protein